MGWWLIFCTVAAIAQQQPRKLWGFSHTPHVPSGFVEVAHFPTLHAPHLPTASYDDALVAYSRDYDGTWWSYSLWTYDWWSYGITWYDWSYDWWTYDWSYDWDYEWSYDWWTYDWDYDWDYDWWTYDWGWDYGQWTYDWDYDWWSYSHHDPWHFPYWGQPSDCAYECYYDDDGECDDGGNGSEFAACALGTDCSDCGIRDASSARRRLLQ